MSDAVATEPAPVKRVRVIKPDANKHKENIAKIDAQIEALRKKQDELNSKINSSKNNENGTSSRSAMIERLKEIRNEQAEIKKTRKPIFDRQEECKSAISKLSAEIKAAQSKQKFNKISDINNQIKKYETQIESGSLRLIDEKKLLNEISTLRRSIKAVEAIEAQQKQIDSHKAELDTISQQLSGTNSAALSNEYNELQAKLDTLKAKHSDERAAIDSLYTERNSFKEKIDALYDQKRAAITQFRTKTNEFYEFQQEDRKLKAESEKAARAKDARDKMLAIAQEQRELAELPAYQDEINNCNTLIAYLQSSFSIKGPESTLSNGDAADKTTSATPALGETKIRAPDTSSNIPEGLKPIARKDEEYFTAQPKKKNQKKKAATPNVPSAATKTGVKLPLTMLERFSELGLIPPARINQVTDSIKIINELKEEFIKNQDKATAENRERAEAKIARLMSEFSETQIE
ncbi:hypothetical protein AYI69_g5969 [Smittium culicis]|uniref:Nuclear segregation protein BFR1 n=1 Tax=Smittium culicis TaxID=133412 RepID=A0A1R1Y2P9_9FUNG|nr:hypothetical protein AYI69_g5969 [Smittium culicis]